MANVNSSLHRMNFTSNECLSKEVTHLNPINLTKEVQIRL